MGALLRDLAVVDDQNLIGILDGVQPVGNDKQSFAFDQFRNGFLDVTLVIGIYAAVASSKIMMGASFRMHRAMEIRCFSPPERVAPPSPTTVWNPSGKAMMKS